MCIDYCENTEWWKTIELVGPYNTGAVQGIDNFITHIYVEMFGDWWDVSHSVYSQQENICQ